MKIEQGNIFEDLFVLELANNHWGDLKRGLKIVHDYSQIVRFNSVKAAIKLQFRDVESFIHKDFRGREDIRYISKTEATKLSDHDYLAIVKAIIQGGCIPMATPFDEKSVDLCVKLGIKIIKIASSDINDWFLIEKIAKTRLPVIVSSGGTMVKDVDDIVSFFKNRNIPLAINHCVSLYPSEDEDLELNQIDYLKNRYPDNVIGFSTHEYNDWQSSIMMAYAKGARTFERHIDIEADDISVSKYCSLPYQTDTWFKAYKKAVEMCGGDPRRKRIPPRREIEYLNALVRGVYAKRELPAGYTLRYETLDDDFYLAIPLQKGQLSCREIMSGETLLKKIEKDSAICIDDIDSPYMKDKHLRKLLYNRGISPKKDTNEAD